MKNVFLNVLAVSAGLLSSPMAMAQVANRAPEPGTLALLGLGVAAAILVAKRKK